MARDVPPKFPDGENQRFRAQRGREEISGLKQGTKFVDGPSVAIKEK